jgi:hypothetical protein
VSFRTSVHRHEWLSRYLPVCCLVAVALVQIGLVLSKDLSRWKGGGFGMFSTTDTPFARFVRVRLVVGGQAHAVLVPASARELGQRARVLPTQERLDALARRLGAGRWIRDETSLLDPESRDLIRQKLSLVADDQLDHAIEEIDQICRQRVVKMTRTPTFRMLEAGDPLPPGAFEVRPEEIQVELWRYRFDRANQRLVARKMRSVTRSPDR